MAHEMEKHLQLGFEGPRLQRTAAPHRVFGPSGLSLPFLSCAADAPRPPPLAAGAGVSSSSALRPGPSHPALATRTEHASNRNNLCSVSLLPVESAFLIVSKNIEHPRLRHRYFAYSPGPRLPQETLQA